MKSKNHLAAGSIGEEKSLYQRKRKTVLQQIKEGKFKFKFGDFNSDLRVPFLGIDRPEYSKEDYPKPYPDVGKNGEHSVIHRFREFGVTDADLERHGVSNILQITADQYDEIITEKLHQFYEVMVGTIFGLWGKKADLMTPEQQWEFIKKQIPEYLKYERWGVRIVKDPRDLDRKTGPKLVIALEGADGITTLEQVDYLYREGVRCITVQYDKPNAMTTETGLTPFGIKAIQRMFQLGMMVDTAHALPKVREAIINLAGKTYGSRVFYTHGAPDTVMARDPAFHKSALKRGISREQLKKIMKNGGGVGIAVMRPFVMNPYAAAQAIHSLLQHENGPTSVGIGADFGGIEPQLLVGIDTPEDLWKLAEILSERFNVDDRTIYQILSGNVKHRVRSALER